MTTSKIKCTGCGYEGGYNSEIYGGLCQECAKDFTTIKVKKSTKYFLDIRGIKSDSYDKIILKIIRENAQNEEKINAMSDLDLSEIIQKVKQIKGNDNEIDPEFIGEIFFDIITLSAIPLDDQERYLEYSFNGLIKRINTKLSKGGEQNEKPN